MMSLMKPRARESAPEQCRRIHGRSPGGGLPASDAPRLAVPMVVFAELYGKAALGLIEDQVEDVILLSRDVPGTQDAERRL